MSPAPLLRLQDASVTLEGRAVLRNVTWELRPGQHWAVLGPNGSGKTTLLKLIRGDVWPDPPLNGQRLYWLDYRPQQSPVGVRERIAFVSPELQQRYLQREWTLTSAQVIDTGFCNTDYLLQRPTARQRRRTAAIIRMLALGPLLKRNVQHLSTGELRKVLIARALVNSPGLLVCDEICDGLDAVARAQLLSLLQRIAQQGTQICLTTHRPQEIFPAITHRLVLEDGRIVRQGPVGEGGDRMPVTIPTRTGLTDEAERRNRRGIQRAVKSGAAETLIRIERADVFLERRKVLRDITWEMKVGEHWAIVGPNGAGKSTLLRLICGDAHPAVGGRVRRLGLPENAGLWQLRRKIGVVSPNLQAQYREPLPGAQVIASGFFGSVGLNDLVSHWQRARIVQVVRELGLGALANRNIAGLSYGEFRHLLLARALVHDPKVLVFDEPFDGLDTQARVSMTRRLERVARQGTQLVIVTHHVSELPACITHGLWLAGGRIERQGRVEDVLSAVALDQCKAGRSGRP